MDKLTSLFSFLRSLWGTLSIAAVLFPGAAALLKVPLAAQNSRLRELYPIVATVTAAFLLLLLTQFRDRLRLLPFARNLALLAFGIGLAAFFAFVAIRVTLLDIDTVSTYYEGKGSVLITEGRSRGLIMKKVEAQFGQKLPFESSKEERGDPWDIVALAFFTATFGLFTASFGALGLHAYYSQSPSA